MICHVSTIPVEVNSRLAAARLPLHVSKLPVESMEDLSCVFWRQKTEHSIFWGTINESITHTLSGDPAGTIPTSHGSNFCSGKDVALPTRCLEQRKEQRKDQGSSSALDVSENSGVKTPQIIPLNNRVFHYFHHPFWGTPIFGNTHLSNLRL